MKKTFLTGLLALVALVTYAQQPQMACLTNLAVYTSGGSELSVTQNGHSSGLTNEVHGVDLADCNTNHTITIVMDHCSDGNEVAAIITWSCTEVSCGIGSCAAGTMNDVIKIPAGRCAVTGTFCGSCCTPYWTPISYPCACIPPND